MLHVNIYYIYVTYYIYTNGFLKIRWQETDKSHLLMSKDKSSEIHVGESIILLIYIYIIYNL